MKKTIGIPGWLTETRGFFGVGTNHLEFVSEFGNPRIIMPHEEMVEVDALYLTGGLDLNPSSYGAVPRYKTSNQDVFKQFFFDERLTHYIENGTPIFGVCLGFQMLNCYFGGSLTQNLRWHPQSPDRWKAGHKVKQIGHTRYSASDVFAVNSHHHQGVLSHQLAEPLIYLAHECMKDEQITSVVEAFKHESLPIAAVQWHPEEFYDEFSINLFEHILNRE